MRLERMIALAIAAVVAIAPAGAQSSSTVTRKSTPAQTQSSRPAASRSSDNSSKSAVSRTTANRPQSSTQAVKTGQSSRSISTQASQSKPSSSASKPASAAQPSAQQPSAQPSRPQQSSAPQTVRTVRTGQTSRGQEQLHKQQQNHSQQPEYGHRPSGGHEPRPGYGPGPGNDPHRHHYNPHRVAPRDRGPIRHVNVGHFYEPIPHYYGYRAQRLPLNYVVVSYDGISYYYGNGVYYRRFGNTYFVCRPPVGVYFDIATYASPLHSVRFVSDMREIEDVAYMLGLITRLPESGRSYYYDDGMFFSKGLLSRYEVCYPPFGSVIDSIPEDFEEFFVGGEPYYRVDNTVYILRYISGRPRFIVAGQMPQAMTDTYFNEYYGY